MVQKPQIECAQNYNQQFFAIDDAALLQAGNVQAVGSATFPLQVLTSTNRKRVRTVLRVNTYTVD